MTPAANKVGILIRTKNRPICLERALQHIIRQNFTDWHIHLLNDGGAPAPLEQITGKYSAALAGKMTVYHNPASVGRGNAAAQLIASSREDYLIIHDDDDTLEPDFLLRTTAYLDQKEHETCVGVITSNYDVFEKIEGDQIQTLSKTDQYGKRNTLFIDYLSLIAADTSLIPICVLFRSKALRQSGSVNGSMNYMEDHDLFVRLMRYGDFGVIQETLASYHHRVDSHTDYDTTRTVMQQGYRDLYFNQKLRQAILDDDNLSKLISNITYEKRSRDFLAQKMDAHLQEINNSIRLLTQAITHMHDKTAHMEQMQQKTLMAVQSLCTILTNQQKPQ